MDSAQVIHDLSPIGDIRKATDALITLNRATNRFDSFARKEVDFEGRIGLPVRPPMPKPIRVRKKSEYIRFRPYHVFTAPATRPRNQEWVGRVLLLVAIVALIAIAGIAALHLH